MPGAPGAVATWPDLKITIRGDSGFYRWRTMRWCDSYGIGYILGVAKNSALDDMQPMR
jgi:hypothetical protein